MKSSPPRVTRIPLEKPASIRRQLPNIDKTGWTIPEFVAGPENDAIVHLFESAAVDLLKYSPIVLYGETMTGKTALAITLAVSWARQTKRRPLAFSTGASFAKDYAAALEIDDLSTFRDRFRNAQLLVIDHLDPLAKKSAAQNELIFTLDALASAAAPVIVTCSKIPPSLAGINNALASRLAGGLSCRLAKPSDAAILGIVKTLAATDQRLSVDGLMAICRDIPVPLAADDLITIATFAVQNLLPSGQPDWNLARELALQHLKGQSLTIPAIAKCVAKHLRVKLSDMRGSTRQAKIIRARGLAILLARKLTSASLQEIGLYFGGRDHSTVLHAFRKTEALVERDSLLARSLADIRTELIS